MNTLRLEELESRQLLSGVYIAPQPHTPTPISAGLSPSWLGEPAAAGDIDVVHAPNNFQLGSNWASPPIAEIGSPHGLLMMSDDPGEMQVAETFVVVEVVVINIQSPLHDGNAPATGGAQPPGTVTVSTSNPRLPAAEAGSTAPTTYVDAPTSHSTSTSVAALSTANRTISPTPFVIVPTTNVPAFAAADASGGIVAPQITGHPTFRLGDGGAGSGRPTAAPLPSGGGVAVPAAEGDELSETKQADPAPIGPGVLATLSAADLSALGRGLERFLIRIERAGEDLVADGDGLRPWLIAGAAAATACEIARRQLKRAAELAAEDLPALMPNHLVVN